MIFLTLGTQEPFDRIIKAMDDLMPQLTDIPVVVQVVAGNYNPKNFKIHEWFTPKEFNYYFNKADLIVSHAGMGTIISALTQEKPIIIIPRRAELGEHRNDHQIATAKKLDSLKYVHVIYNENNIKDKIREYLAGDIKSLHKLGMYASTDLLKSVSQFINSRT